MREATPDPVGLLREAERRRELGLGVHPLRGDETPAALGGPSAATPRVRPRAVRLRDGTLHAARPGASLTLCGRPADGEREDARQLDCATCARIAASGKVSW